MKNRGPYKEKKVKIVGQTNKYTRSKGITCVTEQLKYLSQHSKGAIFQKYLPPSLYFSCLKLLDRDNHYSVWGSNLAALKSDINKCLTTHRDSYHLCEQGLDCLKQLDKDMPRQIQKTFILIKEYYCLDRRLDAKGVTAFSRDSFSEVKNLMQIHNTPERHLLKIFQNLLEVPSVVVGDKKTKKIANKGAVHFFEELSKQYLPEEMTELLEKGAADCIFDTALNQPNRTTIFD